jgi:tripartite-type tricarboxylate transporter receptor subunit TctC
MPRALAVVVAALAFSTVPLAMEARAEQAAAPYPSRPVKVIVGFAAGSGPDVLARAVATQLSADLGHNVYIENRTGANGTIAIAAVAQAETDGHTLLFSSSSIVPVPYVYKTLSFDILRDLAPVATVGILDGFLMLVNPATPVRTVPEFVDYAKKNRVLYGSPGVGNILHLVTELFRIRAGIEMDHIPFKGASEVQTALLGGNITMMFVTPPSVIGVVKEGQLRALAYTGTAPFPEFADVPLMKTTYPDFKVSGSWGMFYAPAKTPRPIVDKLNAAIQKALTVPAVANVTRRAGYVPDGRSAAETAEFFRREVEAAGVAVKAAGITPN